MLRSRLNVLALLMLPGVLACMSAGPSPTESRADSSGSGPVQNFLILTSAVLEAGSTIHIGSTVGLQGRYTCEPGTTAWTDLVFADTGMSFFSLGGVKAACGTEPREFAMSRTFIDSLHRSLFELHLGRVMNLRFKITNDAGQERLSVTIPTNYTISGG